MKLVFREIGADEVEKEVTQRDQFNSDEVELVEALVREAHQNSLDAKDKANKGPVRTRMSFRNPIPEHKKFFGVLFRDLPAHLKASQIDATGLDFGAPRFLIIEDFGTTGLLGAWISKDTEPFSDFWRRIGKSHKGGQQGGRWGLGKLVFSGASQVRTFFGLTVQSDDPERRPLLMGQAVLSTHKDKSGSDLDAHGFFCVPREGDRFQLPERDPILTRNFAKAAGITRIAEPGLSIAIPFIRDDILGEHLIRQLVRNYYFPILMGQLESEIDGVAVNAATFDTLARTHGGQQLADGRLVRFIRDLRGALDAGKPDLVLPDGALSNLEQSLTDQQLTELRARYAKGDLIRIQVPVSLRHRENGNVYSHFDIFLRSTEGDAHALVVRGAITLPLEAAQFRARRAFGALVARDEGVTEFLGDAENPAHTKWNGNAGKLALNWVNPSRKVREIRASLNRIADMLAQAVEKVEPDALIDVFSVPSLTGPPQPKQKIADPKKMPEIKRSRRKFQINGRHGGFAVKSGPQLTEADLPLEIRVSAAYDLIRGNPFRKYNPLDFDFEKGKELTVAATGASVETTAPNAIRISVHSHVFEVSVSGFDPHRDVVVKAVS